MDSYTSVFQRELEKLIEARLESERTTLETVSLPVELLRYTQGKIFSLREMTGLIEEANKATEQRNR